MQVRVKGMAELPKAQKESPFDLEMAGVTGDSLGSSVLHPLVCGEARVR